MERRWLLGAWVAALLGVYTLTLRPSIAWNDSPEFVDVAYTLGIPHPPGSPTYVLLAKLGTFLPVGGIAARVNLFSALCTVLMLVLLAVAVFRVHVQFGGRATEGRISGILCASLLAVAPTFWNYATQAEVYACFTLVVALLLCLAIRWSQTGDERFLLAGAFVFGSRTPKATHSSTGWSPDQNSARSSSMTRVTTPTPPARISSASTPSR